MGEFSVLAQRLESRCTCHRGALQKQFSVLGLPAILFLDTLGEEVREARVSGYLDPEELIEQMQRALASG